MINAWSEIEQLLDSIVQKGGPPLIREEAVARRKQIVKWWQFAGGYSFAVIATPREIVRVLAAFMRILFAIPKRDFQRFMKSEPRFLCSPKAHASVSLFQMPTPVKEFRIISLAPDFDEWSDEKLVYVLAHEIAHLVDNPNPRGDRDEAERRAEALLNGWGFPDPRLASIASIAARLRDAILATQPEERPIGLREFPRGSCADAALLVGTLLSDLGCGRFIYVLGERGSKTEDTWQTHGWAEQVSLIVDITADQFPEVTQPVIVTNDSPWHATFEVRRPHRVQLDALEGPALPELRQFYNVLKNKIGPL